MFSASKTAAPVSGGYQVSNSLRFRSSASAYLTRTPASASNQKTWTWSGWVKRGNLGVQQSFFSAGTGDSDDFFISFQSDDTLRIINLVSASATLQWQTTQVFRDISAWYHIIIKIDTTQATSTNRVAIYINGSQISAFSTQTTPAQNTNLLVNSVTPHGIARRIGSSAGPAYFDGYMAEVNFIDGQALTPSSFGSINATTGVWQPARYTGSYGTNGFYLKFNNGTSTTTLGNDGRSGVQTVSITENDGSAQTIYAGSGACAAPTISTANASFPSAINEYLIVTTPSAIAVTSSLKIYFDIDKTWANGRNLYINGSAISTGNITTAIVSGMYEWTINYSAAGITSISSFTTPQNSGGRAVFYGFSVNGSTVYTTANNWTTNNISLTAGSTYDWMIDSPTSFAGSSYGVGNYAVLNPLDKNSGITVVDGNIGVSGSSATSVALRATIGVSSGKWYWEVKNSDVIGIMRQTSSLSSSVGQSATDWGYISNGNKFNNGTQTAYGASWTSADIVSVALDMDNGTLVFYKNNVSQGTATTGLTGTYFPASSFATTTGASSYNFGQRPFAYTPPTGYKALNTQNLPAPAIYNGANHMAATTYTGTGSSLSISNSVNSASFQPDLVWIKSRSAATDHALYDVIRGTQNRLESNTTDAAVAADNGLTAFGSAGFTVNTLAQVNTNAATYVGWQWKAGGTAVTNTAGTITSQVSANTTAGFSVVTYTGNGNVSATVGHGLGIAPAMVIQKSRSDGTYSWRVYHQSIAAGTMLLLNSTSAAIAINSDGGISSVGSSTFGFSGGTPAVNTTSTTYVAYCFAAIAGYSAFGSYTGNGSADGPFVYCGFRPRFILFKNVSDGTVNWFIFDSSRNTYNVVNSALNPNSSSTETVNTAFNMDLLSNGFKLRNTNNSQNTSGNVYIYAAFAESPFSLSLAR